MLQPKKAIRMNITRVISIVLLIASLGFVAALLVYGYTGIQTISLDLVLAIIMAVIAGFGIDSAYRKFSPQSKILKTTITRTPKRNVSSAKLILPNNTNIIIDGTGRIVGREDFVGIVSTDKLLYIGKNHFRIIKNHDGFYIEDLNTKNGTQLNGKDVEENSLKPLKSNDEILIGKTLKIKFIEKNSNK
jgi:FHA domain